MGKASEIANFAIGLIESGVATSTEVLKTLRLAVFLKETGLFDDFMKMLDADNIDANTTAGGQKNDTV